MGLEYLVLWWGCGDELTYWTIIMVQTEHSTSREDLYGHIQRG